MKQLTSGQLFFSQLYWAIDDGFKKFKIMVVCLDLMKWRFFADKGEIVAAIKKLYRQFQKLSRQNMDLVISVMTQKRPRTEWQYCEIPGKIFFPVKPRYCHSVLVNCRASWIFIKTGCHQ